MPDPEDPLRQLEARAMALLARREYTRAELARRLARPPAARKGRDRPSRGPASERERDFQAALADEFAPPPPAVADCSADSANSAEPAPAARIPQADEIEAVLDRLVAGRLLSDSRAADAIVHARSSRRGLLRVQMELRQKGVPDEIARVALAGLREQQVPAAREVWAKRFAELPRDATERARQTRFLAGRGFSFEVIRAVLGGAADADDAC